MKRKFILISIFIVAFLLRTYSVNWDQGQHLHPDERFLTMVVSDIGLPKNFKEYFDLKSSFNPYNYPQYKFFVYGMLPLTIDKYLAHTIGWDDYGHIHILGRYLSAFYDSLVIVFLYFGAGYIVSKEQIFRFVPSLVYAFLVFPFQQAHFFTVDSFLNMAAFGSVIFLISYINSKKTWSWDLVFSGVLFGSALATKISAVYTAPVICMIFFTRLVVSKNLWTTFRDGILWSMFCFTAFRIGSPYSFASLFGLNPDFVSSLKSLQSFNKMDLYYPPAVQWFNRIPVLFPLINICLWGVGIPLIIYFVVSMVSYLIRYKTKHNRGFNISLLLVILYLVTIFGINCLSFNPTMRYFYLVYPGIALVVGFLVKRLNNHKLFWGLFVMNLIYFCGFFNIYRRDHSRVTASRYIYTHLDLKDKNSINESWDDPLPLRLEEYPSPPNSEIVHFFEPDSKTKWRNIGPTLDNSKYIFMSSNRLWGSISRLPDFYPQSSKYYEELFAESGEFKLIKKTVSYPGFYLPIRPCLYIGPSNYPGIKNKWFEIDTRCEKGGIFLRDDISEEAFTVYDHPQVLIFERKDQEI